ncbi:MAG: hypothetical protein RMM58_02380 [Chloroflexota bacterium]|nr:hypothetical protein [Chloroflexota bacterium]
MDRRRLLTLVLMMLPVAFVWWAALVPAAAQAARCVGIILPWESAPEAALPCEPAPRERRLEAFQQTYPSPTPTPPGPSPTPYVSPTRPPAQTFTPTATPPGGATATPTRTATPTPTRTVTPTGSPVTATPTPGPGTPTATRTVTPTVTPPRPVGTPTATLAPGTPTATIGLPRTGDGTYRGDRSGDAGLLLVGGAALAFGVALALRVRQSRRAAQ